MIKKLILFCLTLLLLIQPSFSDEEEDLQNLLNQKNNLSDDSTIYDTKVKVPH